MQRITVTTDKNRTDQNWQKHYGKSTNDSNTL